MYIPKVSYPNWVFRKQIELRSFGWYLEQDVNNRKKSRPHGYNTAFLELQMLEPNVCLAWGKNKTSWFHWMWQEIKGKRVGLHQKECLLIREKCWYRYLTRLKSATAQAVCLSNRLLNHNSFHTIPYLVSIQQYISINHLWLTNVLLTLYTSPALTFMSWYGCKALTPTLMRQNMQAQMCWAPQITLTSLIIRIREGAISSLSERKLPKKKV